MYRVESFEITTVRIRWKEKERVCGDIYRHFVFTLKNNYENGDL